MTFDLEGHCKLIGFGFNLIQINRDQAYRGSTFTKTNLLWEILVTRFFEEHLCRCCFRGL